MQNYVSKRHFIAVLNRLGYTCHNASHMLWGLSCSTYSGVLQKKMRLEHSINKYLNRINRFINFIHSNVMQGPRGTESHTSWFFAYLYLLRQLLLRTPISETLDPSFRHDTINQFGHGMLLVISQFLQPSIFALSIYFGILSSCTLTTYPKQM